MKDEELRCPTSKDLIDMLTKAHNAYGNRPVKVFVNGRYAIVNDLQFLTNGKNYVLCFSSDGMIGK